MHALMGSEQADDFRIEPGDGLEFAGPVFGIVRPGEPCGLVRLPFGGHAVAEGAGSLGGFVQIAGPSHASR